MVNMVGVPGDSEHPCLSLQQCAPSIWGVHAGKSFVLVDALQDVAHLAVPLLAQICEQNRFFIWLVVLSPQISQRVVSPRRLCAHCWWWTLQRPDSSTTSSQSGAWQTPFLHATQKQGHKILLQCWRQTQWSLAD